MKLDPKKLQADTAAGFTRFFQDKRILFCVVITFLWGLAAHGYCFLNTGFSHDSLNAFYAAESEELWKLELGRFFVPAYRQLFRGPIALPWLIGLISLTFLSAAVYLVTDLLEVQTKPLMILISGVMVTNITIIAQAATYLYELDFNCLSIFLAVLAVWLWKRQNSVLSFLLGSLCVLISMGIYQAYFSTAVTLMILVSLMDLFQGEDVKKVFFRGLRAIAMLLCGGILYFAAGKIIYAVMGITGQSRTDVFNFDGIENPLQFFVRLAIRTYYNFADRLHHSAYPQGIQVMITIMEVLLVLSLIWGLISMKKKEPVRFLLIFLLIGVLPFAMNVTYFLAKGINVHELMIYSVWFVWVIFPVFIDRCCIRLPSLKGLAKGVSCLLVFVLLWQNVLLANTAYMKKDIEAQYTMSTMTRVLSLIEQHEDYVYGETPVAFMGTDNAYGTMPGFESVSTIIGMYDNTSVNVDYSNYYFNVFKAYFRYVLNYPLVFCDDETHYILRSSQEVEDMPAFPEKDCIQMIDGVLVVKLGYKNYLDS